MTLGIIGTAGRSSDGDKLTTCHWNIMCAVSQTVAKLVGADRLVSGGAAYADHCAVKLYLKGLVPNLTLHLPAPFNRDGADYEPTDCGRTSNRYHELFAPNVNLQRSSSWTLGEIAKAIEKGATVTEATGPKGFAPFFERNGVVAADADVLLAFTFGQPGQPALKDGGTADTMGKFLKRRELPAGHYLSVPLPRPAYHFNLTDSVLYQL